MTESDNRRLAPPQQKIMSLLELFQAKKFDAAEKLAATLSRDYPNHTFSWKILGAIFQATGRISEAENANKRAASLSPQNAEAHYNLGITFQALGKLSEAEVCYSRAIGLRADYAEAHSNLGVLLQELGRFDEAEASCLRAIEAKPDFSLAHANLGNARRELGHLLRASESYAQAIKFKPDFALAHGNLAVTLQELGKLNEAEASYKRALALKPDYALAHNNLGNVLKELCRFDEAELCYRNAIALKADYSEAHSHLGKTLEELGRLEAAEISYKKAIALNPKGVQTYDYLGVLLQKLGRLDEAEGCYIKYIGIDPLENPVTKSKASMLFNRGKWLKALHLYDTYNTPSSRSDALKCLYALGRIDEIYQRLEDTADLDDTNLRVAAFSSFIAESQRKDTAHRFCKRPIDFLHFSNLSLRVKKSDSLIENIIEDLKRITAVWEPPNQSARGGFQTAGNLFRYSHQSIAILRKIILKEIEIYFCKFQASSCSFIEKWPNKKKLKGWHIVLKEQGFHNIHIHHGGWLSGVIYLKVVPSLDKNEGAIKFSMKGTYSSDRNFQDLIHVPKAGDIILFPSSLYHGTLPFSTNAERIVVSFDLMPSGQ